MVIEKPVPKGTEIHEIIKVNSTIHEEHWYFVKQYTHHAMFKNRSGIRRCFDNAELYTRGLVIPKVYTKRKRVR